MAKKVQKSKTLKPSTSVKKGSSAKSKSLTITNGYADSSKMDADSTEVKVSESSAEIDNGPSTQENMDSEIKENVANSAKPDTSAEVKDVTMEDVKATTKSRKRKVDVDKKDKKEVVNKIKKQKVLLEIPKRSAISGKVFVTGENDVGQLGLGEDIMEKPRPALLDLPHSIVDIAAGGMHSVCLTETGEVITFGCNDEGALGRITSAEGSETIPQIIDISERIVQISAGDSHSAALSESGQVYIWGNFRNNSGPMGLVTDDGSKQDTPVKILKDIKVVKIASGSDHLACLSQEGVVYTCGSGDAGQLGRVSERASTDGGRKGKMVLLKPDKVPVSRSSMSIKVNNIWTGSYSTFLNVEEKIYACGLNNYNQLGLEKLEDQSTFWKPTYVSSFNDHKWLHMNAGQHHTLALDDQGLVYSLGRSEYGRLGLGENCTDKSEPTKISTLEDKKCVDISSGNCSSFAVTDNGSVYSWGMAASQLGHGDEDDHHLPQLVSGNFIKSWEAFKISGGGQHTLILAHPRKSSEKK